MLAAGPLIANRADSREISDAIERGGNHTALNGWLTAPTEMIMSRRRVTEIQQWLARPVPKNGPRVSSEPLVRPEEQPGTLWDRFRENASKIHTRDD